MTKFEKSIRYFWGTKKNDNAYHECAHLFFSKLFEEIYRIELITVNPSIARQYDPQSSGGVKSNLTNTTAFSLYDYDKAILTSLAGLCADEINNNNGNINSTFYQMPVRAPRFAETRYGGNAIWINHLYYHLTIGNNFSWESYISAPSNLLTKFFLMM